MEHVVPRYVRRVTNPSSMGVVQREYEKYGAEMNVLDASNSHCSTT